MGRLLANCTKIHIFITFFSAFIIALKLIKSKRNVEINRVFKESFSRLSD